MQGKAYIQVSTTVKVLDPEPEPDPDARREPDPGLSSKDRAFYGSFGFYYLDED
jgi:hypothetical protein